MFKSLVIFLLLMFWSYLADTASCTIFGLYILSITTILTVALSESTIIKKQILAETIFHKTTSLFHILKSSWMVLLISLVVAFFTTIVMLIQTIYLDSALFVILGIDVVFIWVLFSKIKAILQLKVKEPFLDSVARKWTTWINTILLLIIFVVYQFFAVPTDEIATLNCGILEFLSSPLKYKELLEWKVVSFLTSKLEYDSALAIWIIYLILTQGIFIWVYSKLLLSTNIHKSIVKSEKGTPTKNYFLIGFIATILLLLLTSMLVNKLYEKHNVQKMQEFIKNTYFDIDKRIYNEVDKKEKKILNAIDKIIDQQIEAAFIPVYYGVDDLSDYYYSLNGEYTRLLLKLNDLICEHKNNKMIPTYNKFLPPSLQLRRCNENALTDEINSKIKRYLFVESKFRWRIGKASENINVKTKYFMNNLHSNLQKTIQSFENNETISNNEALKNKLDAMDIGFNKIFEASSRDIAKKSLSGVGSVMLTSTLSKTIMSKMLLKLGAKSAGKATSFVVGAEAGFVACSPTGPWALACGVVAGTASWIGVDAAITEVDQAFNEKKFQASVIKIIDSEKRTLKLLVKASYHEWLQNIFKELKNNSKNLNSPYEQLESKKLN